MRYGLILNNIVHRWHKFTGFHAICTELSTGEALLRKRVYLQSKVDG